jgi:hypothetical protein
MTKQGTHAAKPVVIASGEAARQSSGGVNRRRIAALRPQ